MDETETTEIELTETVTLEGLASAVPGIEYVPWLMPIPTAPVVSNGTGGYVAPSGTAVAGPPPARVAGSDAPRRRYAHIMKAITERPWAIQPQLLSFMAEMAQFRANGGRLSAEEIADRLAAAADDHDERSGGGKVGAVAVIPMYGVLSQRMSLMAETSGGGTSIDGLRATLADALDDDDVKAIVFDIDSPGGSVDYVEEFASELRALRDGSKPVVMQVNTLAASAAYWLASQGSEIVVTPSGEVGSIGVYGVHEDISKAAEQEGVKTTLISAGPFKTEGNRFEPLSDEARSAMQEQIDTFYSAFLGDVAKGRGVSTSKVESDFGGGRTFLAKKALAAGMVDRIDTLEATVRRLQTPAARAKVGRSVIPLERAAARVASRDWNTRMAKQHRRVR